MSGTKRAEVFKCVNGAGTDGSETELYSDTLKMGASSLSVSSGNMTLEASGGSIAINGAISSDGTATTIGGAWAGGIVDAAADVTYLLTGKIVVVTLGIATGTGTAAVATFDTALPVAVRPAAAITSVVPIQNNAASTANGVVQVADTGVITIGVEAIAGAFTNAAASGIPVAASFSYIIA